MERNSNVKGVDVGDDVVDAIMDTAEEYAGTVPATEEERREGMTIEANGRKVALNMADLREMSRGGEPQRDRGEIRTLARPALAAPTLRQSSMFTEYPDMDEHIRTVEQAVKELASRVMDSGGTAAVSTTMKVGYEWYTPDDIPMLAVFTIRLETKPKPVKEG